MSMQTGADSAVVVILMGINALVKLRQLHINRTNLFEDNNADEFVTRLKTIGLFNYADA